MLSIIKDRLEYRKVYYTIVRSGLFDTNYYLRNNLEIARTCINPIKHYLRFGWHEGRNPNPYFDTDWYLKMYPDTASLNVNPLYHYICYGWKQGYDPSPHFSVKKYLELHPDFRNSQSEPLGHFLKDHRVGLELINFRELETKVDRSENFGKVAIHAHIYYPELVPEFVKYINYVPQPFDCFFTTDTDDKKNMIQELVSANLKAQKVEIRIVPNIGRDIAPFVVDCRDILYDYDIVCHIHTKKSLHASVDDHGDLWRKHLLENLFGTSRHTKSILRYFQDNPNAGILFPKNFIPIPTCLEADINKWNIDYLAKRLSLKTVLPPKIIFPAGSMFWARTKAFEKLHDGKMSYSEFDDESRQLDGTIAHAFERLFVYIAHDNGYSSYQISREI